MTDTKPYRLAMAASAKRQLASQYRAVTDRSAIINNVNGFAA